MTDNTSALRRFADKVYGGINMSWIKVLIMAVASAIVTTVFLVVPIFANTSFVNMGATMEAWFFLAIIIMVNCKKPLEAALKTFVFFLVSQPLIYLFQVPFYEGGWGIFMYYRFWILWTILTFPMAFVGWYLKKHNWLSLLILLPVIVFMAIFGTGFLQTAINSFPKYILSALFCYAQIIIYVYTFTDKLWLKLAGLGAAVVTIAVCLFVSGVDVNVNTSLPDEPSFSDSAVISLADSSYGEAEIVDAAGGYVHVHMTKYGATGLTVTDGDKVYEYKVEAKQSDGTNLIDITPKE